MSLIQLYNLIIGQFEKLEQDMTPISDFAHEYDFEILPLRNDPNCSPGDGNYYECFRAQKVDNKESLLITMETKDKYRSFGNNDDEPYTNEISFIQNGKVLYSKSYTYWE